MKVLLLGHPDIASLYALDRLMQRATGCTFEVCLSPKVRESAATHPAMHRLCEFDAGMVSSFMRGAYVGHVPAPALHQPQCLAAPNDAASLQRIRSSAPDLVVSIRYRKILREAFIAIPTFGVLNLHSGLLPEYRGVMASFWAMLNDATQLGSTLHRIVDSGIDTGPIISRQPMARKTEASYLDNVLRLYDSGTDAILHSIDALQNLRKLSTVQPHIQGDYFSEPKLEQVDAFLAKGMRLVDGTEETLIKSLISESSK